MPGSAINIKANAQEVINLKRKIDELSSALVSMQRSANPALYDKLNSQLQKTTIQYNALRSEVNRYSKEQERAARSTSQTSDGLVDLLKKGAALAGITYGVDKIKQLGSEIISVRGEIQQLQIAFETMLGSKEKADRMMADIKKLALSTPFTLTEVADNTKQIIAMGIASEKAIDTVKMLGDVAAGVSVPLWRVAINYGQVSALGKLQGREIRDFAMAGIPIVDELGKMLGKTSAEIYDMVEAGKIGFPQVEQAFKNMSGEGGKFYNLMEKQNASVTGQISKLKDSIQLMFNEIGQDSEGVIYTSINAVSSLVDNYETLGKVLLGLIATYGVHRAAMITNAAITEMVAASNGIFNKSLALRWLWTERVQKAQAFLDKTMLASPYAWAAAAAIALGYGIYKLATYQTEAEEAQNRLNESMLESGKASVTETRELVKLKGELSAAKKGSEEYKKIKDQIVSKYGQYYQGLEGEIDRVGLLDSTYKKLTESIMKSFGARQYDKFIKQESDRLDTVINENLTKIQDRIYSKFDDKEAAAKYFARIRSAILEGRDLDKSSLSVLDYVAGKGDVIVNRAIEGYIKNIRDAQKITTDIDKKAKERFGVDESSNKATENTTKSIKSLSDQTEDARKKVSDLKKELEDLQSGKVVKESQSKAIEEKVKEIKDAEDSLSYLVSGKSSSGQSKADKSEESAAEKARKQAQEVSDQNERISQLLDKQGLERRRQNEDLANQEAQAYINSISNAAERIRKQRDHDNKLEIQALERQKEDYIRKIIENEREKFEAQEELNLKQDKKYVKKVFDPSSVKVDTSQYDNILGFNIAAKVNEEIDAANKAWNDYFIEFGNYQEKRKAIIEKYNQEISQATQDGEKAALENKKQNALDELDNSVKNSAKLMAQLFADSSLKSVGEIQKIIDKAEMLMNYLAAVKDEQGNATIDGKNVSKKDILNLGISESELKKLELSAQEVEALRNAINKLKGNLGGKSPFKQFESQVKDAYDLIKKGGKENIGQGISGIGSAIQGITPALKSFGDDLSNIIGDEKLGEDIGLVTDAIAGLGSTAAGVGQIMSGDVVGGIKNVVSGISSLVTVWGKLADRGNEKRIQKLQEQVDALGKAYDKLERAIDKAYSKDASNLINQNNKLLEQQKILIQKQIDEEKDKKNTDWDRVKDLEKQIDDIDLIIEDNKEKAKDAIFGEDIKQAIDEFAQAYADAWAAGEDRAKAMKDVVKNMIKGVIIEMLKSDLAPTIAKIREMILGYLSDGIIDSTEQANLEKVIDEATRNLDNKYAWADKYLQGDKNSSQKASSGGFETMSQDTATALEGRFTGMQMNLISIDQNVARIAQWNQPVSEKFNFDTIAMPLGALSQSSLRIERMIEENRNIQVQMFYKVSDIEKWSRVLPQINEVLGQMNNKLDNL